MRKPIHHFALLVLIFGLLLLGFGCSKQPLSPKTGTRVHFKVTFEPNHSKGHLAKPTLSTTIDEAKIVVLDLNQYKSFEEFHQALYQSGQELDQILYLGYSIPWEDWMGMLKSSAKDLYGFYGTFTLAITDTGAVGEISVNPGLNFFGLAFLDNGDITFLGTTMDSVAEGKDNTVELQVSRLFKKDYPHVTIYSPENGQTYSAGNPVSFYCSAWDEQDGQLPDTQIQWSSNIGGVLGNGIQLSDTLAVGTHIIRATATDKDGHSSSAAVKIQVVP